MTDFQRYVEVVSKKEDKRVVNVIVRPFVTDCTGNVWFTDIMLQEGDMLSGYTINTDAPMLEEYDTGDDYSVSGKRFFNAIVRGSATCIIFNLGKTSTGLDYKIYPIQDMDAGSISVGLGSGAHKATFKEAVSAGDELSLLASSRKCLKNGAATSKTGFFQYSAARDSKHPIAVEDKKSARIYVEFQEMEDGGAAQ